MVKTKKDDTCPRYVCKHQHYKEKNRHGQRLCTPSHAYIQPRHVNKCAGASEFS